ncbi:MAG: branched-chain amino acid ABC transporter permease, partial [Mesorhizobium sp.]
QGFTALVVGGVGRVDGALLGGVLLGLLEALVMRYLPVSSSMTLAVPLVVLLAFLVLRPHGLLANRGGH